MAPRKPTTTAKPAKKSTSSKSNKIIKRPARGYHKYKNGLLNVTPKGNEKELVANGPYNVKNNQKSPLLRLPPEIRNRIWGYTLGHTIFRARGKPRNRKMSSKFASPPDEPSIDVSLLRTCRQIYAEAASMPISLNVFAFRSVWWPTKAAKRLKFHQRKQITSIRLEDNGFDDRAFSHLCQKVNFKIWCPAVKRFQVTMFDMAHQGSLTTVESIEAQIREKYRSFLEQIGMSLTVEGVDDSMPESLHFDW